MAEPLEVTQMIKDHLGDLPIIKYIGTCEGKPVYKISFLTEWELSHSCNGGPSLIVVNRENFGQSVVHAWNDWSLRVTPDPDVPNDD